jgi:two-component system, cell cycle response regulator DivK
MKKVILIVEDEPKNLRLFRDILQNNGYGTVEAVNGKQGLDLARIHRPDLILMDLHMPVMDGFEATKLLKSDPELRKIPLIAVTASAMKGDAEKILQAGFDGYITKPIDLYPFLKQIAGYLPEQGETP